MTYYLDPFGCVKNQVDAENMMAFLNRAGWENAKNSKDADLIIVNSCGFIESAKQESINAVLSWKKLYPGKKILLAGCLAQRYAKELSVSLPEADGFWGTDDISGIVKAAEQTVETSRRGTKSPVRGAPSEILAFPAPGTGTDTRRKGKTPLAPAGAKIQSGMRPLLSLPGSAYVKISEGCDNRCSFCAIPLIRGGLWSRSVLDITRECKALLKRGIKELCLIGQDTGSYGRDRPPPPGFGITGLPGLMEALSRLEGNFWVRLLYIHPDHFPLAILDIMEKDKRFIPYFDIPFQHGSEKILKAMNRAGNAKTYLGLIKTIRGRLKDAVIRSTFLTGFPGETEDDFEMLLDFQEKARLDWLGCFAYSREENTPAWGMKGRPSKKTALERKRLIEERQIPITQKQMSRFTGKIFQVLVEEKFNPPEGIPGEETRNESFLYLGRLPCQAPEVDGAAVIFSARPLEEGALVSCKVIAGRGFDLEVRPLADLKGQKVPVN